MVADRPPHVRVREGAPVAPYTVRQGGKAGGGGRWRHWQPVRTRWNKPSSIRRMSVVRGRPPGLAGGIIGASRAYCSSPRACPAPTSPTSARLSAVPMARLREGLLPSRPADATAPPHARLNGASFSNGLLAGVVLDHQVRLHLHRVGYVGELGDPHEVRLQALVVEGEVLGHVALGMLHALEHVRMALRALGHLDRVALAYLIAWDVHALAVDQNMAVIDQLPGGEGGRRQVHPVHH